MLSDLGCWIFPLWQLCLNMYSFIATWSWFQSGENCGHTSRIKWRFPAGSLDLLVYPVG